MTARWNVTFYGEEGNDLGSQEVEAITVGGAVDKAMLAQYPHPTLRLAVVEEGSSLFEVERLEVL
jgi:hypothetical protein